MGCVGSREIVLLKSRNDLFVKLSLHQELPEYFTSLDPSLLITFCTQYTGSFIHTKIVEQSPLSITFRYNKFASLY